MVKAVAVAAVRPGSERAASAARRPSTGKARRSGQESPRTRGRIANGASRAIPKKIAIVPSIPAAATIVVVWSEAPSQKAPARPRGIRIPPIAARRGRRAARRPSVPSTALIGEVRPARRAGYRAPRTAVTIPVATAATGAALEKARSPTGKSSARINSISPTASATPSPRPSTAPSTPSSAASRSTDPVILQRPAPSVRSIPISRVRWKTVMLNELKIRKPPTNRAIAAKK